jgi:hypothetical protein
MTKTLREKAAIKFARQRKHLHMVHYPPVKGGIPVIRAGLIIEDENGVPHHAFRKPNKHNDEEDYMMRRMAQGEHNRLVYAPDELRPAVGQGKKKRATRKRK